MTPDIAARALTVLGMALTTACSAADSGSRDQSPLVLIDSTSIAETDSTMFGAFTYLNPGPDGSILIADHAGSHLLHYDRSGTLLRIIGRKGMGPGELQGVMTALPLPGDSLLAAIDARQRAISIFNLATGEFRRRVSVPFQGIGNNWSQRGDTIIFAVNTSPAIYAKWNIRSDSVLTFGQPPAAAATHPHLYMLYGFQNVALLGDRLIAQLPMVPGIVFLDADGTMTGGLTYPPKGSRGVPADLAARHGPVPDPTAPMLGSSAIGLHVLPSGHVATLTLEYDRPDKPETIRFFLTLVDVDRKQACVDIPLPVATDAMLPLPIFQNGQVLFLARHLDAGTNLRSVLYRYRIDPSACSWTAATETAAPS